MGGGALDDNDNVYYVYRCVSECVCVYKNLGALEKTLTGSIDFYLSGRSSVHARWYNSTEEHFQRAIVAARMADINETAVGTKNTIIIGLSGDRT